MSSTLVTTPEQALEETRDMFLWAAANPGKGKSQYPNLKPGRLNDCSCCEFARVENPKPLSPQMDCTKCPLQSLWGNSYGACENQDSPYRKWRQGERYTDSSSAAQIANAASEELRKLREGKKDFDIVFSSITESKKQPQDPYAELKQAQKEGKMIQYKGKKSDYEPQEWTDFGDKSDFDLYSSFIYRIKPTPKYRPWKAEEVPVGAKLRDDKGDKGFILCATDDSILTTDQQLPVWRIYNTPVNHWYYCDMLTYIYHLAYSKDEGKTWLPCGVLVEE